MFLASVQWYLFQLPKCSRPISSEPSEQFITLISDGFKLSCNFAYFSAFFVVVVIVVKVGAKVFSNFYIISGCWKHASIRHSQTDIYLKHFELLTFLFFLKLRFQVVEAPSCWLLKNFDTPSQVFDCFPSFCSHKMFKDQLIIFSAPKLEPAISQSFLVCLSGKWYLETNISALGILIAKRCFLF